MTYIHIKPKTFILIALTVSFFLFGCKILNKKQDSIVKKLAKIDKKQNILFISIDDLRPLINVYDAQQMITPNLDKLSANSIKFNNAFTNIAVCGASREIGRASCRERV